MSYDRRERNKGKPWTADQEAKLEDLFLHRKMGAGTIADRLGRTAGGICAKLKQLGWLTYDKNDGVYYTSPYGGRCVPYYDTVHKRTVKGQSNR